MAKSEVAVPFGFVKVGQGRVRRRMPWVHFQDAEQPAPAFFLLTVAQQDCACLVAPLRVVRFGHDLGCHLIQGLQVVDDLVQLELGSDSMDARLPLMST